MRMKPNKELDPTSRTARHRGRFVCIGSPLRGCPEGTSENSPAFQCAVKTEQDSRGRENPTRQLSLRRKQSGRRSLARAAAGAPDVKGSNSESASEQVLIGVNTVQASKRAMRTPIQLKHGEGCHRAGSERSRHRVSSPGYW